MSWRNPSTFQEFILGTGRYSLGDDPSKEPSPILQLGLITVISVAVVIGWWVGPEKWGGPEEWPFILVFVAPVQLLVMIRYMAHYLLRREILLERAKQDWKGD